MFVKKGGQFLPGVSLKRLQKLYEVESHSKSKLRLQCAILRKKGNSQPFIAEVTGKPVTTVSDILRRFEERGVAGCHAIKQTGQPVKLSIKNRLKLNRILSKSPEEQHFPYIVWTSKLVQYTIKKLFKVFYTLRQITNLLKSIGFTLQKPRQKHILANKRLQAQFKKNFDEELNTLGNLDMRSYFWTKQPSNSNHT